MTREDVLRGLVKATPEGMLSRTTRVCAEIPRFGSAAAVRRELKALADAGMAERVDPFDHGWPERWKPTDIGRVAAASTSKEQSDG